MTIELRNELRQGQKDILKVIVVDGKDVGVCHRHHRMANWIIADGIGEQMSTLVTGVPTSQLKSKAAYLYTSRA